MHILREIHDIINSIKANTTDIIACGSYLLQHPEHVKYRRLLLNTLYPSIYSYSFNGLCDIVNHILSINQAEQLFNIRCIAAMLDTSIITKIYVNDNGAKECILSSIIANAEYMNDAFFYVIKTFKITPDYFNNNILDLIFNELYYEVTQHTNDSEQCIGPHYINAILPMRYLHRIGILENYMKCNNYSALHLVANSGNAFWMMAVLELCDENMLRIANITPRTIYTNTMYEADGSLDVATFDFS